MKAGDLIKWDLKHYDDIHKYGVLLRRRFESHDIHKQQKWWDVLTTRGVMAWREKDMEVISESR